MVSEEKSKYVSANRDPGPPSCFSNPPEKHNLGRGLSDLASCQVLLNSIQRFQVRLGYCFTPYQRLWLYNGAPLVAFYNNLGILRRRSRKCLSKSEDRVAGLFLQLARKHKLSRGRWDLASCKVLLHSVQRLQRRCWKCSSNSEARVAIWFFRSARKTQTW